MRRRVREMLRLFSDIAIRIPGKDDTIYQKIAKGFSIVDRVYSAIGPGNVLDEFIKERKLIQTSNRVLVDLLFSSLLLDEFKKQEIKLEDYGYAKVNILELKHNTLGSLYFVETTYNSGEKYKKAVILHSKEFDFKTLMEQFWACYEGKLHIGFSALDGSFNCSEFPTENLKLYGKNSEVARDLAIQHLRFMQDKVSRSYLLLGEPGTGKSSCAMYFASKIGNRIIKIDGSALVLAGKNLRFMFNQLLPDFVLIDDIDKEEMVSKNMSSVLSAIEWIKMSNPEVTIIFTANDIKKLDKAFWRPGRVDSITLFEEPSKEDRVHLVKGFIEQFRIALPEGYTIEKIVDETDGMSPVWVREIILRFKYDSPQNVLSTCRQMFKIVNGEDISPKPNGKANGKSDHPVSIEAENVAIGEKAD